MSFAQDVKWMSLALGLAEKGRLSVSPNPMVGACVVRGKKLVAADFHRVFGGDHAEAGALKAAGRNTGGATLYVTLEPCSTWGKTAPCAPSVIESGVSRVVIATKDPNPAHNGKGIAALKKAGIQVTYGVLEKEAAELNRAFFKWASTGLPFVTLKMAQSLDGKIAARSGLSRWISSPASRQFVHELRAEQDAVMVGKNTLFIDNPFLNPRVEVPGKDSSKPWRIALDPDLKLSPKARVYEGPQQTLTVVLEKNLAKIRPDRKKNLTLLPVAEKKGRPDLKSLLNKLGALGVSKLLVEGGGEIAWSLLSQGLVDKSYWIIAPKVLGGRTTKTSVEGEGVDIPAKAFNCRIAGVRRLGEDWVFEADFK